MWNPRLPRDVRALWFFVLLALIAAAALLCERDPPPGRPAGPPVRERAAPETPLRARREVSPAGEVLRVPVAPTASALPPSFAERVDHLAETARTTSALVEAGREDEARRSDEDAREQFAALMAAFPDAGEQALMMLSTVPSTSEEPLDTARRAVLQRVLSTTFTVRHAQAEAAGDRSRIDPLVGGLLTVMHLGGHTTKLGGALLVDEPLLRLSHEPAVLEIVALAGEGEFDRDTATRLLLTLWHNLQASGERSSDELASMAMILLADSDASKRTAACRQLLLDDRYRPVVLAWVREHRDVEVASDLGVIAARELAPPAALRALRELAAVLPSMPTAYMLLASRAEDAVIDAYYDLLATGSHTGVRSDLICGIGMVPGPQSLEAVEYALNDPALEVRAQAALTLSILAPTKAEAALGRLLDDPRTANDAQTLHIAVLAVDNLAAENMVNAVDRLGQRLRAAPLMERSRQRLEGILARSLPGGRTSR